MSPNRSVAVPSNLAAGSSGTTVKASRGLSKLSVRSACKRMSRSSSRDAESERGTLRSSSMQSVRVAETGERSWCTDEASTCQRYGYGYIYIYIDTSDI